MNLIHCPCLKKWYFFFFFFQAEDGIRDLTVTGVQTCALPISRHTRKLLDHYGIHKPSVSYHEHNEAERTAELIDRLRGGAAIALVSDAGTPLVSDPGYRSEERRVGKEGRCRWAPDHSKKKKRI